VTTRSSSTWTTLGHRTLAYALVVLLALSAGNAQARRGKDRDKDKGAHDLILKNADYNENELVNGKELVSTLRGNVIFLYDDMTVHSDNAKWWRSQGTVKLDGNVRMNREDEVLTCDRMTYLKEQKRLEGEGRVDYRSPSDGVRLYGQRGNYDLARDVFTITGDPHFVRVDSTNADTMVTVSLEMSYDDSLHVATARRNVKITRGKLVATGDRALYNTDKETAHLRGKPHIVYDRNTMDGDSVDLFFKGDTLDGVSVVGRAHGLYTDADSADTNVTNVWSDSMYLATSGGDYVDSVWAFGDVRTTYYLSSESDSANEVTGKTMILAFERAGKLRTALVRGNARSTYYVREKDSDGRNEASGDTILVLFERGKASELTIGGSVRGKYLPSSR
jgi:lipopolysaccharide export system protein LptA